MTLSDIARSYRDKYGMEMPSLKLARIMYAKEKLSFKNVEAARSILRRIEGKNQKPYEVIKTKYYMPTDRPKNPYKLPASDEADFTPYKIKGHKRILILSDIHVDRKSVV